MFMQYVLIGLLIVDRSRCFVISSDHKSLTTTNCITTKFKLAKVKKNMSECHLETKYLKETNHTSSTSIKWHILIISHIHTINLPLPDY